MQSQPLILFIHGAGGHAKSIAEATVNHTLFFVDPFVSSDKKMLLGEVIHSMPLPQENHQHIVGIGDNQKRASVFLNLQQQPIFLATITASSAQVSQHALIGAGCFIGHHAYIGPDAMVGENCIINTGAIVEHDAQLGAHSHIAVGACIAGSSKIGSFCQIGTHASIIDGITLCDHVIVGAGAIVTKNIVEPGTYVGVPARKIK